MSRNLVVSVLFLRAEGGSKCSLHLLTPPLAPPSIAISITPEHVSYSTACLLCTSANPNNVLQCADRENVILAFEDARCKFQTSLRGCLQLFGRISHRLAHSACSQGGELRAKSRPEFSKDSDKSCAHAMVIGVGRVMITSQALWCTYTGRHRPGRTSMYQESRLM